MKKLLFTLIVLSLTLTTIGCGGSSSNNSPADNPTPISSDYIGLEPGFQLTYHETGIINKKNINITFTSTTITTTNYVPGVFKQISSMDPSKGELILKEGNNYYDYGHCFPDSVDEIHDPPYELLISNPINPSFERYSWGLVKGQENVTVPAGTFNAWIFEEFENENANGITDKEFSKIWFVPYLGVVKVEHSYKRNGETIDQSISELISSTKR